MRLGGEEVSDRQMPVGWRWKTIEALAGPQGLVCDGDWVESKDQDPTGAVRLIQLADVGDGYFRNRSDRYLTREAADRLGCTFLAPGDILIARMPDPLGRACILPDIGQPAVTVVDVCVWRSGDSQHDPRWLMHFINSPAMRSVLQEQATGTTRQRISGARLKATKIPTPPLDQQIRIVARIEELFGEIEAGEQELAAAKADLARYRRAVLKAAVTGELTRDWREHNPPKETGANLLARILKKRRARWEAAELTKLRAKGQTLKNDAWKTRYPEPVAPNTDGLPELPHGWVWASVDQLMAFLTSGSRGWAEHYSEQGPLFIRAQNINTDALVLDDIAHVSPPDGAEGARTQVRLSDLLITITGANVTKTAILNRDIGEAYVSQHVALLRLVDPDHASYIHTYLLDEASGRGQLLKAAYGAGKPGLNLENIRSVLVCIPPMSEQAKIVAAVNAYIESNAALNASIEETELASARLRQSILAAAFSGKLVAGEAPVSRRRAAG